MKYFLDTEFDENGKTIELISIAIVRDDGAELYLISNEFDPNACNDWVKANVLPKLGPSDTWVSRASIAEAVRALVGDDAKPEFWAYFADYDWVALCQLFGRMVDLPKGFPFFCMDIKQWAKQRGVDIKTAVPQPPGMHNALVDARWNQQAHGYLDTLPLEASEGRG